MVNTQIAWYLGSKILAAILNLVTMAIFVRMGGKETYGAYVLLLAWAYMLYSVTLQWLRFSFFACFNHKRRDDLVKTYLYGLVSGGIFLIILTLGAILSGLLDFKFAFGIFILVFGLAAYEAISEIARTQLQAKVVAIGVLLRALFMLGFGLVALSYHNEAFMLALSFGFSHLVTALLLVFMSGTLGAGQWDSGLMQRLWRYGKPLMQAFGLEAAGLQADRVLLDRYSDVGQVGLYGAATDFIRQSMIVVSEAISGAYFTVARAHVEKEEIAEATDILGQAFMAYTALTCFAGAFILRFDRLIFDAMFGADMGAQIEPMVTFIVLGNIVGIYRTYYLSQGIYLTQNSGAVLYSNLMHLIIVLLSGVFLVASYGGNGAAMAMLLGHIAGCAVFIVMLKGHFILDLPYAKAMIILGLSLLLYFLTGQIEAAIPSVFWSVTLNIGLFILICGRAAYHYNILSFAALFQAAFQTALFQKIAKRFSKTETACSGKQHTHKQHKEEG